MRQQWQCLKAAVCLGTLVLLSGCLRHRAPATLPPVIPPKAVAPEPPPPPIMQKALPEDLRTAKPVHIVVFRPRRIIRRSTSKNAPADTSNGAGSSDTTTVTVVPEDGGLGELSTGDDSNPQAVQDAMNVIGASQYRLDRLPHAVVSQQASQVRRVRYFLNQARQALNTGDAEGARTLATKAQLLLNDLTK